MAITLLSLIPDLRDELGDFDETDPLYSDPKLINFMARTALDYNTMQITKQITITGSGDARYIDPDFENPYKEEFTRIFILLSSIKILKAEILNAARSAISKISPLGSVNLQSRRKELREELDTKIKEVKNMLASISFHQNVREHARVALISISDPLTAKFDNQNNNLDITTEEQELLETLNGI